MVVADGKVFCGKTFAVIQPFFYGNRSGSETDTVASNRGENMDLDHQSTNITLGTYQWLIRLAK